MDLAAQRGWAVVEDEIAAEDALVDEVERSGLDYLDSPGEWHFAARPWDVADAIDLSGGDPDEVSLSAWSEWAALGEDVDEAREAQAAAEFCDGDDDNTRRDLESWWRRQG